MGPNGRIHRPGYDRLCPNGETPEAHTLSVTLTPPSPYLKATNVVALVFGACAVAAVLLSVFVMASRPFGCSANSAPVLTCDWVTSRVAAVVWLIAGLSLGVIALKRWYLALSIISGVLTAISLFSALGVFTLASAAFWFGCGLWLRTPGERSSVVASGLASVVLLYFATNGVRGLLVLYSTPI